MSVSKGHLLNLTGLNRQNSKAWKLDTDECGHANYITLWPGPKEEQEAHLLNEVKPVRPFLSLLFLNLSETF